MENRSKGRTKQRIISRMSVVHSYLLIFVLNLSELNTPIKGQWLNGYKNKKKKIAEVSIFYWTKQTLSETATEDKEDHYIIKSQFIRKM